MVIAWDEPKRLANLDKHGMDFATLTEEFFANSLVIPARDGRFKAIGELADGVVIVIFLHLGSEGLSVISMRPASRRERRMLA